MSDLEELREGELVARTRSFLVEETPQEKGPGGL